MMNYLSKSRINYLLKHIVRQHNSITNPVSKNEFNDLIINDPNIDLIKLRIATQIHIFNKMPIEITSQYPNVSSILTMMLFYNLNKQYIKVYNQEVSKLYKELKFSTQCLDFNNAPQKSCEYILSLKLRLVLVLFSYTSYEIIKSERKCGSNLIFNDINEVYYQFKRVKFEDVKMALQNKNSETLQPKQIEFIISSINKNYPNIQNSINQVIDNLSYILRGNCINFTITARIKSPYSTIRKVLHKTDYFENLHDIVGIRIVVDKTEECYDVLSLIHKKFDHIPSKFKDYIKAPKLNGYQSLHTVVLDKNLKKIEIQIRSRIMHLIAEFGTASHLLYKMQHIN